MITVFRGGRIFVGNGEVIPRGDLVLEDEKILAVGPQGQVQLPSGAEQVYDVSGKTILPGLIDAHIHITGSGNPDRWERIKELVPHMAIRAAVNARRTLEAGFTTIRDAGAPGRVDIALKQAINEGLVPGPRMLVSGRGLSITGGHGDSANGWPPEVEFKGRYVVDGVDAARRAAREQLRDGADQIKLHATGGVMSEGDLPTARGLTLEEMRAAIEEANNVGKKSMTHAQGSTGIKNAILAGINSIEHGFYLTDEIIELMLKRDVFFVPTLAAMHHIVTRGTEGKIPAYAVAKAREAQEAHTASFRRALAAGVKIAMGTDAATPFNYHGNNALELELMVQAGMSPRQALLAATKMGAELLGLSDKIGALEPGKLADVVVVDGDPLEDVKVVQKKEAILLVMKEGRVAVNRGLSSGGR
ncbi:MAG: amidohydrolase family protein [Firmicutes bacterium]|nr:amidohydrolase family protein [Bacillota bacterium]MCL5040630.1 amidohydrolase family protein [Bacillota bacterium]